MARTSPPPRPDFLALESAAARTAPQRQAFLAQIGDLNFAWSNNESMLIYVIMLLLKTDEIAAAIVFSTLNTTRSRVDLIQRLSKTQLKDTALRREIEQLLGQFIRSTRVRNEFNHATYVVSANGEITHTHSMKLEENRGRLRFGVRRPVDEKRKEQLETAIRELQLINRCLWDLLPRLNTHMTATKSAVVLKSSA
jgi:hypothetical protein